MEPSLFFFWVLAVIAVVGAIGVVVMRQPIHSALFLLLTLLAVAGLFVLNHAEFLFAVQILVYTGGIMVLFIFTIMLVNVKKAASEPYVHRQTGYAVVAGLLLFVIVGAFAIGETRRMAASETVVAADPSVLATTSIDQKRMRTVDGKRVPTVVKKEVKGNSQAVAWGLYRDYLVPFEVASIFLLVAMIGAVVLGKRSRERID